MADGLLSAPFTASLGTRFSYDVRRDTVLVVAEDGSEAEVPAPDLREYLELLREAGPRLDYDETFRHVATTISGSASQVSREKEEAPALLAKLLGLSSDVRAAVVRSESRYHSYSLAALALERSRGVVYDDPLSSRDLADLGRVISECVSTESESSAVALRAYAQAVYGNALRVIGDLRGATQAFRSARTILQAVGDGTFETIEVSNLEVSLRRDLREFDTALELSVLVVRGFLDAGMVSSAAKAMLTRASVYEIMDDQEKNLATLREAAHMIEIKDDPWVALMVRHNLIFGLALDGRHEEAEAIRQETLGLYEQYPVPGVSARRSWAEGLISWSRGELDEAAQSLTRARTTFMNHGYGLDTALVSLDLAATLSDLGRHREVREIAAASFTLLEAQGVHPDALAALAQFQQAAAQERLTRELVRRVARRVVNSPKSHSIPS